MTSIRSIRKRGQRRIRDRIWGRKFDRLIKQLPRLATEAVCQRIANACIEIVAKVTNSIIEMDQALASSLRASFVELHDDPDAPPDWSRVVQRFKEGPRSVAPCTIDDRSGGVRW